jgi:hypothetical protein
MKEQIDHSTIISDEFNTSLSPAVCSFRLQKEISELYYRIDQKDCITTAAGYKLFSAIHRTFSKNRSTFVHKSSQCTQENLSTF